MARILLYTTVLEPGRPRRVERTFTQAQGGALPPQDSASQALPRGIPIRPARGVGRAGRPMAPGMPPMDLMERFKNLQLGAIWRFYWRQPLSFKMLTFYLLFEYVRPQTIYPVLDVLPWATVCLGGALAAALFDGRLLKRGSSADLWLVLYTAVILLSSSLGFRPEESYSEFYIFAVWLIAYLLITRVVDTEERFFVFMGLFMLFSLKMSQHATRGLIGRGFSFEAWGASGAPGWFQNSGEMAIQMAIFGPIAFYFYLAVRSRLKRIESRWKYYVVLAMPVTALLAVLASSSRGGQIAAVGVVLYMLWRSRNLAKGLALGIVVGGLGWLGLPAEQRARFTEMGDDQTSQTRLLLWEDAIEVTNRHPVLGIGYEAWMPYYIYSYGSIRSRPQVVHNIFLQASSELGYTGFFVLLMMIFWTFRMNSRTRRRMKRLPDGDYLYYMSLGLDAGLVGFMVAGFFVTVLYYPFFWVNYAMTAALFLVARDKARAAGRAGVGAAGPAGPRGPARPPGRPRPQPPAYTGA